MKPDKSETTPVSNKEIPPPNGFTKNMRRVMSVLCLIAFFVLIFGQAMGLFIKEVPTIVLVIVFSGSLMMFDVVDNMVKKFAGGGK